MARSHRAAVDLGLPGKAGIIVGVTYLYSTFKAAALTGRTALVDAGCNADRSPSCVIAPLQWI